MERDENAEGSAARTLQRTLKRRARFTLGSCLMACILALGCSSRSTTRRESGPSAGIGGFGGGSSGKAGLGGAPGDSDSGCPTSYQLTSYVGSTDGLCGALESSGCCVAPEEETGFFGIVCAPDGSFCTTASTCSVVDPVRSHDCGWTVCEGTGSGGEGGAAYEAACPPDLVSDAFDERTPPVCVSDSDCPSDQVCNQRHANRMFCGPRT